MIAIFLSPIYLGVHIGIFFLFLRWLGYLNVFFQESTVRVILTLIYLIFPFSTAIGFVIGKKNLVLSRFFKRVGNYCLGISIYIIMITGLALLADLILCAAGIVSRDMLRSRDWNLVTGGICIAIIIVICIYGIRQARDIRVTPYAVEIKKNTQKLTHLKIVLAADLHIGYNAGCAQIRQMVERINGQEPDIVVFAGDIFDNEYEALENPEQLAEILRGIRSKYGVYACYGNHDIDEKILAGFTFDQKGDKVSDERMDRFLQEAEIVLLQDEFICIEDDLYLYGRPDASRPGRGIQVRRTPQEIAEMLDMRKPVIIMDHQPKELQELSEIGTDVDLCGHTHDGQLFPGNYVTGAMWENSCGYLKKREMHNIVTSGVGVFAPYMRVGTKAEICTIEIKFTGKTE